MKRLIVDMDDVLADATGQFINYYEKEFGIRVPRESMNHKVEMEWIPANHDAVFNFTFRKDFFRTMEVNPHSQEVMKELNAQFLCQPRLWLFTPCLRHTVVRWSHWYAERHRDTVATLVSLTMSVVVGTAVCEMISSGSFYFLSGRFEPTGVAEFARRFMEYFPRSLSSIAFYICIAGMIHVVVRMPIMSFSSGRTSN